MVSSPLHENWERQLSSAGAGKQPTHPVSLLCRPRLKLLCLLALSLLFRATGHDRTVGGRQLPRVNPCEEEKLIKKSLCDESGASVFRYVETCWLHRVRVGVGGNPVLFVRFLLSSLTLSSNCRETGQAALQFFICPTPSTSRQPVFFNLLLLFHPSALHPRPTGSQYSLFCTSYLLCC